MEPRETAEVVGEPYEYRKAIFPLLEQGLSARPHEPAVVVMTQDPGHLSDLSGNRNGSQGTAKCLTWTYTQLHSAALKLVSGLAANGAKPGMSIATLIPNRVEYHLILWTCQILRLTLCSLDFAAINAPRREELSKYMSTLRPDIILVHDDQGAIAMDETIATFSDSGAEPKIKLILDSDPSQGTSATWRTISSIAADGLQSPMTNEELLEAARKDDPDRIALILFTSGTSTGNPKGCPKHVASTAYHAQIVTLGGGVNPSTRALHSSANFRVIAPALCLGTWCYGGTIVMQDPAAGPQGTLVAIREHGVNTILTIPALLHALVTHPEFAQTDVSRVQEMLVAGDVVTKDIFSKLRRSFPNANHTVSHGMTEGGGLLEWPWRGADLDDKVPYFGEICPLGIVSLGTTLRIRNAETGQTLKRNEIGELCFHGPAAVKNYLDNQYSEMFFSDPEGKRWFRTGDLGLINDDGVVYIVGRLKDVIKRSGIPITPAALESCIEQYTGSQAAALAYPHPILGQEPLVVLKSLEGKTEEEIKEHVVNMFNKDYALGAVVTLEQLGLGEFPLNATGKIMKIELLKAAQECFGNKL